MSLVIVLDLYGRRHRATAHVSPVTTTILAAIYAMLGENSVAARVALSLLSVASYCAATRHHCGSSARPAAAGSRCVRSCC
ncbi:MAG: hypothetical protein WDN04_19070 [Rhodospirillales bacterium]